MVILNFLFMFSEMDPGLPYGESRDIHEFWGTGMTQYTPKQYIPAEMQIAWIQDPVKKQYRQMCNEVEPFPIPNN
jgi:hypothetical protein